MRRAASDFGWIFFNAERFIQEAIQSTSELLLVDDACSTDESTAIGRQYAEQRPEQVRYRDHARLLTMGPILTLLRGQLPRVCSDGTAGLAHLTNSKARFFAVSKNGVASELN